VIWRRFALIAALASCASEDSDDPIAMADEGTADGASDTAWPIDDASGLRVAALPPLPELAPWPGNPRTAEKRELGRALFYDARLSSSGTVACATCHLPISDFQSNTPRDLPSRSLPELNLPLPRHTPSLLNIVFAPTLHWDGSESDLIASMTRPFAEANMDLTDLPKGSEADVWALGEDAAREQLHTKLQVELPGYLPLYDAAFDVDAESADAADSWLWTGMALAVFVADAQTGESAFDRWNRGEDEALSDAALEGLALFMGDGACIACHHGPMLSDFQFHNLSLMEFDEDGEVFDRGRAEVTGNDADHGAFLTPPLRRVTRTSPFFHHGAEASLAAVIKHHSDGATAQVGHDPILDALAPLTDDEVASIVEFLRTLEGPGLERLEWGPPSALP